MPEGNLQDVRIGALNARRPELVFLACDQTPCQKAVLESRRQVVNQTTRPQTEQETTGGGKSFYAGLELITSSQGQPTKANNCTTWTDSSGKAVAQRPDAGGQR